MEKDISYELAASCINYDADSGHLFWSKSRPGVAAGARVGSVANNGYIKLRFMYSHLLAHRVAWLLHSGAWPANEIDHINGIKHDNRLCNLREATRAQNSQNKSFKPGNVTPLRGAILLENGKWDARINANNKTHILGQFCTPEAAHAAYCEASKRLHGEFAYINRNEGKSQ